MRREVAKNNPYFAGVIAEMEQKRAEATTLLHSSPKLQRILYMIYREKGPVSLAILVKEPRFKDQHRLSEEQLANRLADLLEGELLVKVGKSEDIFTVPMWASSFIAARIEAIRAGEL